MTLGEKQQLFVELEHKWVAYALQQGYKLRHGEGRIAALGADGTSGRKADEVGTGRRVRVEDREHMQKGAHYTGIGADWNLFVDGQWLVTGNEPEWLNLGAYWESLHELCRWGGRFGDANHISLEHEGRK